MFDLFLGNSVILGFLLFNILTVFTYHPFTSWKNAIIKRTYRFNIFFILVEVIFGLIFILKTMGVSIMLLDFFYNYIDVFVFIEEILFIAGGLYLFILMLQREISPTKAFIIPEITLIGHYILKDNSLVNNLESSIIRVFVIIIVYWILLKQLEIKRY